MIQHRAFRNDPWSIRETELDLGALAQTESVFALSNGHIGLRGNLDEGEPFGLPGTYLSGFYELRPLPYAEAGFGYPEEGQSVVNVTNGKIMRLLVEDEPFDVRYGTLRSHERILDFRSGLLERRAEWVSPTEHAVRVFSTRLVSFTQRAVAAICYEVEPVDRRTRVVIQSELIANEDLPSTHNDPRAAAALAAPLKLQFAGHFETGSVLVHSTAASGLTLAAAMDHVIEGAEGVDVLSESFQDLGRFTVAADLDAGRRLRLIKFVTYGWSSARSTTAVRDQVRAALSEAKHTGWDGLVSEQKAYLDDFWEGADVELRGDEQLQQAVRFGLFHTLQAGARAERRAIAAKGLTGSGYDGHAFWDTEMYVLPVLTYSAPRAARDALLWRHSTLGQARARAQQLGYGGATFPWRTIRGEECSSYWPAGTAAFHINADIADAAVRYRVATDDDEFERSEGAELLVETARFWSRLGHYDSGGAFRIDGVTGPDEYSAICDNNVYTNLMAQRNLRAAADVCVRHPEVASKLGVDGHELGGWNLAADAMRIPFDTQLGIHPQADQFTEHQMWDFESTSPDQYPLLLHYPYFDLYRKQVVKQADLVLAMHVRGDAFTDEQKLRNFDYYEAITVRDSSLSACTQAVLAAEVGHTELAYRYITEAALMDLEDLDHNTRDGLHIASLAGTWIGCVAGLAGMRDHDGALGFAPRLPREITSMSFRMRFRGRRLLVRIEPRQATYSLLGGRPLPIVHHGEPLTIPAEGEVQRPIPVRVDRAAPSQPRGREPGRKRPRAAPG